MTSKIRISMDKMSLSVDVGENANFLFLKMANELLCNAFGKENTENILNKMDSVKRTPAPAPKMKPIVKEDIEPEKKADTEPNGKTEIEPENQIKYKGFIYWKCADCGHIRGFCTKKESKGVHCMDCGSDYLFKEPLKPLYAQCECGSKFRYLTNMDEEIFDMECIDCGSPIPIKWNGNKKIYETIQ